MNESTHAISATGDSTTLVEARTSRLDEGDNELPISGGLLHALLSDPELVHDRSFVVNGAVAEFERLSAANPALTPDDYCCRFDGISTSLRSSIYRQLEVEKFVNDRAWLKEKLTAISWPTAGEKRGSFRVIEEIARGSLSRVYLCTQPQLGNRQVVVKATTSAECEADSLGRLNHPNIVPILSAEMDAISGLHLLCMPFLGRSTLYDYLAQPKAARVSPLGKLVQASRQWEQPSDKVEKSSARIEPAAFDVNYQAVAWIGKQLASALAHAHSQGVFHGDIKPSNILLSRGGIPLLMDFNLSGNRALARVAQGGTLPYMPPEQLRVVALGNGDVSQYDQRSDIFSLAVVLYEALTGQVPFPVNTSPDDIPETANALLYAQKAGPQRIKALNPEVPQSLAAVVERCLRVHPDERIQTADELESCLQAENRFAARLRSRISRNRVRFSMGGFTAMTVVVCVAAAVAARPPKHVRLLISALDEKENGRLGPAQILVREALQQNPDYIEAKFELARLLISSKAFTEAHETLAVLEESDPSARIAAYTGYCFNLQGNPSAAIPWYELALERGSNAPEVLNNLAYSYMMGSSMLSRRGARERAEKLLLEVRALTPDSPAALLNWINLAIERQSEDRIAPPDDLPEVCAKLVKAKPRCGFCLDRAAAAIALVLKDQPNLRDVGVDYLLRAVELGHGTDTRTFRVDPTWSAYLSVDGIDLALKQIQQIPRKPSGEIVSAVSEPKSLAATVDASIP